MIRHAKMMLSNVKEKCMSQKSEVHLSIQQEVARFWEQQAGVTVDKTADGGIVLWLDHDGRYELKPHQLSQVWLSLQPPLYIIHMLQLFLHDLEERYATLTQAQRLTAIETIAFHLSQAEKQLERG
jgi:hypothetical protein